MRTTPLLVLVGAALCAPLPLPAGDAVSLLTVQSQGTGGGTVAAAATNVPQVQAQTPWVAPGGQVRNGEARYRARADETLQGIAQRVYGDPAMWRLIYYANLNLLNAQRPGGAASTVDLVIPPPARQRVFQYQGRYYVRVLPGDTFRTLARSLYGRDDYWPLLYLANRGIVAQSGQPLTILVQGAQGTQVYTIPQPGTQVTPTTSYPTFPGTVPQAQLPAGYQAPAPQNQSPAASQGTLAGTGSPLASLNLSGPDAIGRQEAETILRATGFICSRNPTYERAMAALAVGYYKRGRGTALDATSKQWLFKLYTDYRAALSKWGQYPTISTKETPQLMDQFIRNGAPQLTAVPANKREALLRSLMTTESGQCHWSNFTPTISNCGAVGLGQFLPATAAGVGINPFDPEQNVAGIGKYLNGLIAKHGLRKGLACYNGGGNPPASSYAYADRILARAGLA